jgi:hypothetical protein
VTRGIPDRSRKTLGQHSSSGRSAFAEYGEDQESTSSLTVGLHCAVPSPRYLAKFDEEVAAMRVASLVLLTLLCACGASVPRVPAPAELQGLPDVTVSLAPQIDGDRAQAFREQDGASRLRNAVLDEMIDRRQGLVLTPSNEVRVLVTRFRLRSTAAGVWVGAMAGADMLDVTVALVRDDKTLRTFDTGVGGLAAGLIKPTARGRFNGLVKGVAARIVEKL